VTCGSLIAVQSAIVLATLTHVSTMKLLLRDILASIFMVCMKVVVSASTVRSVFVICSSAGSG